MTNTTTDTAETAATTEAPEVTTETEGTTETAEQAAEEGAEEAGGGREAAKYRRRLRETETERDTLAAQVAAMQRAEVERVAAEHLKIPAGLWASGADLPELLADDGTVDPAKVASAAVAAREALGLASARMGNYSPREGNIPKMPAGNGWADAFNIDGR